MGRCDFPVPESGDQAQGLAFADPVAGGEGTDGGGVDVGVGIEIEVGQPFFAWEPRSSDSPHHTSAVAVVAFGEQKFREESVVGELVFAGCGGGVGADGDDGTHGGKPKSPAGLIDCGGGGFLGQTSAAQRGGHYGGGTNHVRAFLSLGSGGRLGGASAFG
ncbi:hypothetical protein ABH922_005699 [Rhodococcus sp. 27YEA15]